MRDWEKQFREEWFKDHQATVRKLEGGDGFPVFHLNWVKPGTCVFSLSYLMMGPVLMVTGDVGDALYRWSMEGVFLEDPFGWLATLHPDYFASKCLASEYGRGYKEWFQEKAKKELDDQIENGLGLDLSAHEAKVLLCGDGYQSSAYDNIVREDDWVSWLRDRGGEVFGAGAWEMADIGQDVAIRCRSHLFGIKMAMEQLGEE